MMKRRTRIAERLEPYTGPVQIRRWRGDLTAALREAIAEAAHREEVIDEIDLRAEALR